jgi:hypothetical protein
MSEAATTLGAGRRRFFRASGFPLDGGYEDAWAEASFGPVRYAVPDTRARASALGVHDLHHVLTGYAADWRGESEISAWELGSGGGGRFGYAWFIALFGLLVGLVALPGATWRAFARGRGSRNLFADPDPERWLDVPIPTVRAALGIAARDGATRIADRVGFAAWSILAFALGAVFVVGAPVLVAAAALRRGCPLRTVRAGT